MLDGKADAAVLTGDSLELMGKLPEECVDYIFTDPPYDAAIQYGELVFSLERMAAGRLALHRES